MKSPKSPRPEKKKIYVEKQLASMQKIVQWKHHVDFSLFANDGMSIKGLIEVLEGYNSDEYRLGTDYDTYFIEKGVLETDADFLKRKKEVRLQLEAQNREIERREAKERAEYERLKRKFGNDS